MGIVVSITVSGLVSFMIMRVFRAAIRDKAQDRDTICCTARGSPARS